MKDITLLTLNAPTANGRIYSTAVVQKALDDLQAKPIPGIIGNLKHQLDFLVNLANVKFTVTGARIEGDLVLGEVVFTQGAEDWQALLRSGESAVGLAGVGRVDEVTKEVSDYAIGVACLVSSSSLVPA